MRFSADNKGYKIERTNRGDITVMSPVGGVGGVHEGYVYGEFYLCDKRDRTGNIFSPSAGFNLPDGSCFAGRILDDARSLELADASNRPVSLHCAPTSSSRSVRRAILVLWSRPKCSSGWITARSLHGWSIPSRKRAPSIVAATPRKPSTALKPSPRRPPSPASSSTARRSGHEDHLTPPHPVLSNSSRVTHANRFGGSPRNHLARRNPRYPNPPTNTPIATTQSAHPKRS